MAASHQPIITDGVLVFSGSITCGQSGSNVGLDPGVPIGSKTAAFDPDTLTQINYNGVSNKTTIVFTSAIGQQNVVLADFGGTSASIPWLSGNTYQATGNVLSIPTSGTITVFIQY